MGRNVEIVSYLPTVRSAQLGAGAPFTPNNPVQLSAMSNDPVQSSVMSTDSRPPPPCMDINPCPEQIDMCSSQNVVFGLPITNEWFFGLYEVMKEKREVREASQEFLSLVTTMAELCQSMYPDWGHISPVVVAAGSYGECTLIRIGMHG